MIQAACPFLSYRDRLSHLGAGSSRSHLHMGLDSKGKARLDDHVLIFGKWAWTHSGAVASKSIGVDQDSRSIGAALTCEPDKFVEQPADGFTWLHPIHKTKKYFKGWQAPSAGAIRVKRIYGLYFHSKADNLKHVSRQGLYREKCEKCSIVL